MSGSAREQIFNYKTLGTFNRFADVFHPEKMVSSENSGGRATAWDGRSHPRLESSSNSSRSRKLWVWTLLQRRFPNRPRMAPTWSQWVLGSFSGRVIANDLNGTVEQLESWKTSWSEIPEIVKGRCSDDNWSDFNLFVGFFSCWMLRIVIFAEVSLPLCSSVLFASSEKPPTKV